MVILKAAWQVEGRVVCDPAHAICGVPHVLTHLVVIRYRRFAQLSLKIQVYCEVEVSLQNKNWG